MRKFVNRFIESYIKYILMWLPGNIGEVLRYYFYKNRFQYLGEKVSIPTGCVFRGEQNIIINNNVGFGLYSQLYAGINRSVELIEIGENTKLNSNVMINADIGGIIQIGKNVLIGPNVVIRASNHNFEKRDELIRLQGHTSGRIIIGDDVWIGANVVILPNISIGTGAVIGAGSVVTKDIADYSLAIGIPAKIIRSRE